MFAILNHIWRFRAEILLAVQLISSLRKTAKEFTRDYIRRRIREQLKRQVFIVGIEIAILLLSLFLVRELPALWTKCLASLALWAIVFYNLSELVLVTIPELRSFHRYLRGKTGYALKYFLGVSLLTELMRLNLVFLALCLFLGISTRTYIAASFSLFAPWRILFQRMF